MATRMVRVQARVKAIARVTARVSLVIYAICMTVCNVITMSPPCYRPFPGVRRLYEPHSE